jgi:endonuclease G, mitochondrial
MNRKTLFRMLFYPLAFVVCITCFAISTYADETKYCDGPTCNGPACECQGHDCESCQCGPIMTVHATELPRGAKCTNYLLVSHLYTISLDPETKLATWCCYRVTRATGETRNSIDRKWVQLLPDQTLEPADYVGPEFDMGHLAPIAALKNSPFAYELNAMVNITPQRPDLNRGPWVKMETQVRQLAETHESVDVAVGPLFERPMPSLPAADEAHKVPSAYWAVISPTTGEAKAYVIDQQCSRGDPLSRFAVSIDEVSRRSGLSFPRKR